MTDDFEQRNREFVERMGADDDLRHLTREWFAASSKYEYSYHFKWLGRPIIQFPQDIVALQEIINEVRPQLIIETGIARGGSLIFSASMLELLGGNGRVIGIDIEIRSHNRVEIERHPLARRITMIEGSSVDEKIFDRVLHEADGSEPVLVILDSDHTHAHVLRELEMYSPLVHRGSYLVVFDTVIAEMPDGFSGERPWSPDNNPKTAIREFLKTNDRFEVDRTIEDKLLITVAPGGYLRCIKD